MYIHIYKNRVTYVSLLLCRVLEIQDFILRSDFMFKFTHEFVKLYYLESTLRLVSRNETTRRQYHFALILNINVIHSVNITP